VCFSFAMKIGAATLPSGDCERGSRRSRLHKHAILLALPLKMISIPIVGFIVFCILGSELLLILAVGYLI